MIPFSKEKKKFQIKELRSFIIQGKKKSKTKGRRITICMI